MRFTLDATNDGVWDWNVVTGMVYFSPHWYSMLGYEPGELPGTIATWRALIHLDDTGMADEKIRSHIEHNDESFLVEFRMLTKQGDRKWILARGKVVERDAGGNPVRVVGTHTDITGRKQVQEALQESEEKLRLFIRHAPAALAMFDRDMHYLAVSLRWIADYHLKDQDILGRSHYEIFPEITDTLKAVHRRALAGEVVTSDEDLFVRADGTPQWLSWEVRPWYTADNIVGGVVIFSEDITSRKRGEEELRESEKRLRLALSIAHMGYWRYDVGSGVVQSYEDHGLLFGITTGGNNRTLAEVRQLVHAEDRADAEMALHKTVNEGIPFDRIYRTVLPGGDTRWLHSIGNLVRDSSGKPEHVFGVTQDITPYKNAELQLERYNADLEKGIAERTASLYKTTDLLQTEVLKHEIAEQKLRKSLEEKSILLKEIHNRVKSNLQVIASLLNLQSRYITDEKTLHAIKGSQGRVKAMALIYEKLYRSSDISHIDLADYIRFLGNGLLDIMGAREKGIVFKSDIRDIFLDINSAINLGLMANELIANSLRHAFPAGRNGEIALSGKREDHTISLVYRDNGVGIPKSLDWRNAESLGLRLVCLLVEQMDGTIELDRTGGTAFTIVVKEKE